MVWCVGILGSVDCVGTLGFAFGGWGVVLGLGRSGMGGFGLARGWVCD